MDQRERYLDEPEGIRLALSALQSRLWTALPCVVTAFPCASGISEMMLDCQPTIAGTVLNAQGSFDTLKMPLLINVPISWAGGGGVTLTFPIKPGDECLVVFASRCIDSWWQRGALAGVLSVPPDQRMHNLSDGFAIVGVRSLPREYAVNPLYAELSTDDGLAAIALNPLTHEIRVQTEVGSVNVVADTGNVNVVTGGSINMNGVTIDKLGNMTVPGNITSAKTVTGQTQVVAGVGGAAVHLTTHNHPSNGAPPTPGS